MVESDDALKVGLIIVALCFASALAAWDPSTLLDGGSDVAPKSVGNVQILLNQSSIEWGTLDPGSNETRGLLVTNTGKKAGVLSLDIQSWEPRGADEFLFLSWDQNGSAIGPGKSVAATFLLEVSPLIQNITDFSCVVVVVGEELAG
jgi:hypothetical protein